jgi:hypothetical protein
MWNTLIQKLKAGAENMLFLVLRYFLKEVFFMSLRSTGNGDPRLVWFPLVRFPV